MVFSALALALVAQRPGLEHDEALLLAGGVHIANSSGAFTLPHDPHTWACIGARCLPLMTVRYVGAVKEYLSLPIQAFLRGRVSALRLLSGLLAIIGLLCLAMSAGHIFGQQAAAAAASMLAVNPAYLMMTLFDNGAVAVWMALTGLLYLAAAVHLTKPSAASAFLLGLVAGVGMWARANFLWLLLASTIAVVLLFRRRALRVDYWLALAGGAVLGSAPLLLYQVLSRGGTFEALGMFSTGSPLPDRIAARAVMLAETLLYDREHRAMWAGPALPLWQRVAFPAIVVLSCIVSWVAHRSNEQRRLVARSAVAALGLFVVVLFVSRMQVAEHHLVAALPMAAFCVAGAVGTISFRSKIVGSMVLAAAVLYAATALWWNLSAIDGLRRTGGRGQWSDAVFTLAGTLDARFPGRPVKILDWGLQNNLYVLTRGKLVSQELFTGPASWKDHLQEGGLFLLSGDGNRHFPQVTKEFLAAVNAARPTTSSLTFRQREGLEYASLLQVYPAPLHGAPPSVGLYPAEQQGWRWTRQAFSIALAVPANGESKSTLLELSIYIPDALISRLGPVTLSAYTGELFLGSETYRTAGPAVFVRELAPELVTASRLTVDFALDKVLPGSPSDSRELGVIVSAVSLRSQ
jgi:hypothetical protein